MAQAEQETRAFIAETDAKLKGEAASSQAKLMQPVIAPKQAVVTKIKQKPSKKRSNIIKLTDSVAKISKKKQTVKEESKQSPEALVETAKIEEKIAEQPKYCELSQTELADFKAKILTKTH